MDGYKSVTAFRQKQAAETAKESPKIADLRPELPMASYLCLGDRYTHLALKKEKKPKEFPNTSTKVRVVDGDTFDMAIELANTDAQTDTKPVCVMSLGSSVSPGGGFIYGCMAQEEELCYRSTLYKTLNVKFYPFRPLEAIYSPSVIIFRENWAKKHAMMDLTQPDKLPVMAVVTVAAEMWPRLNTNTTPPTYADEEDRELMKEKIRVALRVAAHNGHHSLVLGALGCGVFENPNEEVADCFAEVLQELEFRGWFSNVVFAVMKDKRQKVRDNYDVFKEKLDGLKC
ncbi:hypothetical protein BDV18DRAFT_155856 [Aspergillus unguis]